MVRAGTFWALVVALSACGESRAPAPLCAGQPCPVERTVFDAFQQSINRKIDLLFVVDDTPAIAPHRLALNEDFGRAAAAMETITRGGLPSIHLGVVSASRAAAGDSGCVAKPRPECGLAPSERFLATGHCGRMPNFTRPFTEMLPCVADLGSGGCGVVQPLAALRRALDPSSGSDFLAGFLRPDAHLVVVIVAAGDDASGEGASLVAETTAFLEGLKDNPAMVLVSVVGPPVACGDAAVAPVEAPRLRALVEAFGGNGIYQSLCGDRPVLHAIQRLFESNYRLSSPCFVGARDTDPTTPGLQADCTVEDHAADPDAPPGPRATKVVPSCDVAAPPCWRLTPAKPSGACSPGSALFTVERAADWCAQTDLYVTVACLGCAQPNDPACAGP